MKSSRAQLAGRFWSPAPELDHQEEPGGYAQALLPVLPTAALGDPLGHQDGPAAPLLHPQDLRSGPAHCREALGLLDFVMSHQVASSLPCAPRVTSGIGTQGLGYKSWGIRGKGDWRDGGTGIGPISTGTRSTDQLVCDARCFWLCLAQLCHSSEGPRMPQQQREEWGTNGD